jgi:methyl-accepting chemotaxis protein
MNHRAASLLAATLLAAPLLVASSGCDAVKKQKECNAIAETINKGIQRLDEPRADLSSDDEKEQRGAIKEIGDIYGDLAKDVRDMPTSSKELEKLVEEYATMADDLEKLMKDLDHAVEDKDEKGIEKAQKKVNELEKEEERVVSALETHCNAL